jgi:hypothetical protein
MAIEDHQEVERWEEQAEARAWSEYDSAALWCAKRGFRGEEGGPLPEGLSAEAFQLINEDVEAFQERVRGAAYGLAIDALEEKHPGLREA